MSGAISGLLGAIVGGLAAIGGCWLQARNAARLQRQEAVRQENHLRAEKAALLQDRRRHLAVRYLYQLGDAVDSLLHRVDNWAHQGGARWSESQHPGYWELTSLYALARALGAERPLALEGVYVELHDLSSSEEMKLPARAVEVAVGRALGQNLFYYHRLALAEVVLDRAGDNFRLLTYSEFLRRYNDPEWNLTSLLEPVRTAFGSLHVHSLERSEQSLAGLSKCIRGLTASHDVHGVATPDSPEYPCTD
jgi:hypothetical protein